MGRQSSAVIKVSVESFLPLKQIPERFSQAGESGNGGNHHHQIHHPPAWLTQVKLMKTGEKDTGKSQGDRNPTAFSLCFHGSTGKSMERLTISS